MPETLRIDAADGYALGATVFGATEAGPVVVINGATAVKQRYYARFAQWLSERGAVVVTYDYRGVGASRPHRLRGFQAKMRDWGQLDLDGVLRFVVNAYPGRARLAVGHSVGGQLLGFAPHNVELQRVVTVAAQSGYWRLWPGVSRLAMAAWWYALLPVAATSVGYLPGAIGIGEDIPRDVALEWARWAKRPGFFTDDGISPHGFARMAVPMQAWSFSDDSYAPRPAVDWLHSLYARAQLDRRHHAPRELGLKKVGHFGAFSPSARESLWPQFADFLLGSSDVTSAPARVG